jgi:membrane-bound ClpP family serine protease
MVAILIPASSLLLILCLIVVRSRHHKRHPITNLLVNSTGIVDHELAPQGTVLIGGELWLAKSVDGTRIPGKTPVIVVGTQDHFLLVS